MSVRDQYNPKREFRDTVPDDEELAELAERVAYKGSPYHKRNPGDFGLTPPSQPRADKTLCDKGDIFEKAKAEELLERGIRRGMISEREKGGFPKNVWAVQEGMPFEAQLQNHLQGTYHGYPLLPADPFHDKVLERWDEQ